jgi:hypothetical protein
LLLQAAFTERGGSTWGRGNALASGKEGGQECFEEDLPICKVIEWPLGGGGSRSSGRRAAEHLVIVLSAVLYCASSSAGSGSGDNATVKYMHFSFLHCSNRFPDPQYIEKKGKAKSKKSTSGIYGVTVYAFLY